MFELKKLDLSQEELLSYLREGFAHRELFLDDDISARRIIFFQSSWPRRDVFRLKCLNLYDHEMVGWTTSLVTLGKFAVPSIVRLPEGYAEDALEQNDEQVAELRELVDTFTDENTRYGGKLVWLQGVRDGVFRVNESDWSPLACSKCTQVGIGFRTVGQEFYGIPCQRCLDDFLEAWDKMPETWQQTAKLHKSVNDVEQAEKRIREWNACERLRILEEKANLKREARRVRQEVIWQERERLSRLSRLSRLRRRKIRGKFDLTSQLGALSVLAQPEKGKAT